MIFGYPVTPCGDCVDDACTMNCSVPMHTPEEAVAIARTHRVDGILARRLGETLRALFAQQEDNEKLRKLINEYEHMPYHKYKFEIREPVEKVRGYKWPGVVVARFLNMQGEERYVVECTEPNVSGALHIYGPDDLVSTILKASV